MTYAYKNSSKNNQEDDDDLRNPFAFLDKKRPYKQFEETFQFQHIHYYISDAIVEPELYTEMIHRILMASINDVIYIHLNTSGGRLDTGVQIINAMQNSQAKIVTVLDGMAYSLGTLIFLAGDEMIVNDHCIAMFHNFRSGIVGKGNEITSELDATVKWFADLAKQIYIPFLSDDELSRIIKGEDLWMRSAEVRKRLDHMIKVKSQPKETTKRPRKQKEPE